MDGRTSPLRVLMAAVSWIGLVACSVAGLGYLLAGAYNLAGLMLALAVLSWINIRRKRGGPHTQPPRR